MLTKCQIRSAISIPALALCAYSSLCLGEGLSAPPTPWGPLVDKYIDTLLEVGRDTYGPQKSGLFLSALDRKTLKPLTTRPAAPAGIRESDRSGPQGGTLVGTNPELDESLLRILFLFGQWRGDQFPKAAEEQLFWFLKHNLSLENARPWLLWEKCFQLAPDECKKFALCLIENNKKEIDSQRHAGFFIRTWAEAYASTKDETFLKAIDEMLTHFEKKRHPKTGLIEMQKGSDHCSPASSLSMAIDCDGASRKVPDPLAARLTDYAAREDKIFCNLPHDLKGKHGFAEEVDLATGKATGQYTSLWQAERGRHTTASMAMMCVSRYENTGYVGYRDLISDAADLYLHALPAEDIDLWPMTLGHDISLELAAYRATSRGEYHLWAYTLGQFAMKNFWADSPLPKASLKSDHYESITGADSLAIALEELWVSSAHVNGVLVPANTIDR